MPENVSEVDNCVESLKELGNTLYKEGDFAGAIQCYTDALKQANEKVERAVLLKNRAATYLKQEQYSKVLEDCNESLALVPHDPKALFRRALALEQLERIDEAYKDAKEVQELEPQNKALEPVLRRLYEALQEKVKMMSQVSNKVSQMFQCAFDKDSDLEKCNKALNNLLVLARERAASALMMERDLIEKLMELLSVNKTSEIQLTGIRLIGELCKGNVERTKIIVKKIGMPWFSDRFLSQDEQYINAVEYCIQTILKTLGGLEASKEEKEKLLKENALEIDTIMSVLLCSVTSRVISGIGRDAILEIITRNVDYQALQWAEKFVKAGGVTRMMEVSAELPELPYESNMKITESTKTLAAVCLGKVYDNMWHDLAKQDFINKVEDFVKDKLLGMEIEDKVRVASSLTTLLRGPLDVGNSIIAKEGFLEMLLVMANSGDTIQQKVSAEALIAAASKKDKAKSIVSQGTNILKSLYQSKDDHIKVRALVGLCKLGASGGTDASYRPFAEGSTLKLAEACRRFLIHPAKDRDMRKWAVEGLSYLTLDAEVKEKLIEDKPAINAMIELAKTGDQSVVYGCITTLVNLTNSYDKQEIIPEMIELAKFAKQHIPEEHELDDPDFVTKRVRVLGQAGVTVALVSLSKTESKNCKELICRVFNALCEHQDLRGLVVQQGGAKVLIPMALDGTDKGKKQAAQALARIGITINPEVAFPGQRACEVVRPLLQLLHPDCKALENFEALMCLTNLAGMNLTVQKRIMKEGGFSKIEHYMYEDHLMLKKAATQCITNLCSCSEVLKYMEGKNDRVKYLLLLSGEQDEEELETGKAAAGALAILTSVSKKCCQKIFDSDQWLNILQFLVANPDPDVQHRGVCIVHNMMTKSKSIAEKLIETSIMELLMALSQSDVGNPKIREYAEMSLKAAEEWKLIKANDGEEEDGNSDVD
ncbi:unnamed protein product [Darwinula stevensoni]|uniref:Protein unc-45 homolog B n=1 Tax=Darwinula stevensoni TaxID=69355 RepID=A0A7R9A6F6_9CRUS|nr:unnamed protein product [Darwinula stevensoni]CAG0894401.1 unnamed protein product [Darwinula stevensoni]